MGSSPPTHTGLQGQVDLQSLKAVWVKIKQKKKKKRLMPFMSTTVMRTKCRSELEGDTGQSNPGRSQPFMSCPAEVTATPASKAGEPRCGSKSRPCHQLEVPLATWAPRGPCGAGSLQRLPGQEQGHLWMPLFPQSPHPRSSPGGPPGRHLFQDRGYPQPRGHLAGCMYSQRQLLRTRLPQCQQAPGPGPPGRLTRTCQQGAKCGMGPPFPDGSCPEGLPG